MDLKKILTTQLARKVPEIIALFWIIKLLTTALGESVSDYLVHTINPVIAVLLGAVGLAVAIVLQFWAKKYIAGIYWLAVVMVAIFGTMAADVVHIVLGVPYLISTIFFSICLVIIFNIWYKTEHSLSIHTINNPGREVFYWTTVMITFALGTAAGDMTAITLGWGYLASGILFIILFLMPLFARKFFKANETLTFWLAYIVTRPLGASFADYFGRTPDLGGLGYGTGRTSIVLVTLIVVFVGYLAISRKDVKTGR
ncbi:hypothetical protein M1403_03685 [Patescibacteria group bacterium]|nr:hypothetical protein [Patescibacteria group bacterium]